MTSPLNSGQSQREFEPSQVVASPCPPETRGSCWGRAAYPSPWLSSCSRARGFRGRVYVDQHSWDTREQEENINIRKPNTDLQIISCHAPMHELT